LPCIIDKAQGWRTHQKMGLNSIITFSYFQNAPTLGLYHTKKIKKLKSNDLKEVST
jgi:hypothetical protein